MTGKMPEEGINPAEFPDLLYDLWRSFLDLHSSRGRGWAMEPITHQDIQAYSALHGVRFEEWELAAIRALDAVALGSAGDEG